jgi:hypothetical protein
MTHTQRVKWELKSTKIIILSIFWIIICSNKSKTCITKAIFVSSKILRHLTKRLACIVTGSQPLDYFAWKNKLGCTKHNDFGQMQNPLNQDSGRNATPTDACRVHIVRKEMLSCCEGAR